MKVELGHYFTNLTDSHCHLTSGKLSKDIAGVLGRARQAGVKRLLTVGQGLDDSRAAIELARRHPEVSVAIGFAPHGADGVSKDDFEQLAELADDSRVVALGEVGLDYYYDQPSRETQQVVFAEQVRSVEKLRLPLIIHCRDAWDDC